MKKMVIFLTALAMIAGFSTASLATVVGSKHDLSDNSLGSTEVCIFCHTPHNAQVALEGGLLWNRTAPEGNGSFTLFDGTTSASATAISAQCLSCHDGVTQLDAFGGSTGTAGNEIQTINATANVGVDLSDDHPVMVTYTSGTEFNDVSASTNVKLFGGNVECASCHNPHEENPGDGTLTFLRSTNAASALCRTCHIK